MNKPFFYLSIVLASALILPSCSDVADDMSSTNDASELTDVGTDSGSNDESDPKIETVVTTDEDGNQLVTKIETKADGTKVKVTAPATAEEIREIAEKGTLLSDSEIPISPEKVDMVSEEEPLAEEIKYDFHAYEKLNTFLGKYVSYGGNVNYSSINSNKAQLEEITKEFESNFPGSGWSSAQKLTYWINAYNVYTIKLIVDNYPTSSITNITAKPWHKKFIKLNGSMYSLNQIENDIVRKQFNEPRIHFALNCGSESCPVLLNKAYTPGTVYSKMTSQTKRFLKDSSKNTYGDKEVQISQIFDWYGEDFTKGGKTVFDFINKYRTEQLDDQKITYQEYSWDLNN